MTIYYFGEPWPAGLFDDPDVQQVPTPSADCVLCEEPVVEGDQGTLFTTGEPAHRECSLRSVVGGIEHLTAEPGHALGSCYEGSTLTYRESALQAWKWVQEHGIGKTDS